jgi:hypothetical protein
LLCSQLALVAWRVAQLNSTLMQRAGRPDTDGRLARLTVKVASVASPAAVILGCPSQQAQRVGTAVAVCMLSSGRLLLEYSTEPLLPEDAAHAASAQLRACSAAIQLLRRGPQAEEAATIFTANAAVPWLAAVVHTYTRAAEAGTGEHEAKR